MEVADGSSQKAAKPTHAVWKEGFRVVSRKGNHNHERERAVLGVWDSEGPGCTAPRCRAECSERVH